MPEYRPDSSLRAQEAAGLVFVLGVLVAPTELVLGMVTLVVEKGWAAKGKPEQEE